MNVIRHEFEEALGAHRETYEHALRTAVQHANLQLFVDVVLGFIVAHAEGYSQEVRKLLTKDVEGICSEPSRAAELKAAGNTAFQHAEYAKAIELYTGDPISLKPAFMPGLCDHCHTQSTTVPNAPQSGSLSLALCSSMQRVWHW